ncbi:MAG: type III-B CRISPR module-associated protein Cmr5 [Synergistaceae bacterium]|nr:type III-B CRISPR module-associated protein Cmr5 [Synergistaceae bacterium]
MLDFRTKEQSMAGKAFERVNERQRTLGEDFKEYKSFALSFPSLIHSCGLVQALAFANAKDKGGYISDLQKVFDTIDNGGDLLERSREAPVMEYMRITRHAINAASWIKRYCQAINTEGGGNLAELPQGS